MSIPALHITTEAAIPGPDEHEDDDQTTAAGPQRYGPRIRSDTGAYWLSFKNSSVRASASAITETKTASTCDAISGLLLALGHIADPHHPPLPKVTILVYHGHVRYQLVTSVQAAPRNGF